MYTSVRKLDSALPALLSLLRVRSRVVVRLRSRLTNTFKATSRRLSFTRGVRVVPGIHWARQAHLTT